jgi:hypothetical protein
MTGSEQLDVLHEYAQGTLGTREAIRRAGLEDFADLLIALSQNDLLLPKPAYTPQRRIHVSLATAALQPLLRGHAR